MTAVPQEGSRQAPDWETAQADYEAHFYLPAIMEAGQMVMDRLTDFYAERQGLEPDVARKQAIEFIIANMPVERIVHVGYTIQGMELSDFPSD